MNFKLNTFTAFISVALLISGVFINNANAHLLTITVDDAEMTIDDYGRISSLIIEGQEQLNESYWYTSVRQAGGPGLYSAPLRVDANNYNVVNHVMADGLDGWSLAVERKTAPSDIQFEYRGRLLNDFAGDGTATFSANAFWRNINSLTTGNTDCDCYLFIDPNLSGTPDNDITTMVLNPDGTMQATFSDQIDGEIFSVLVRNVTEWEVGNNVLLQAKLDNAITNVALDGITSPYLGNGAVAFKGVTHPGGLDADGCGCNIDIEAVAVPLPPPVWLLSLGVIGLVAGKCKSIKSIKDALNKSG